jgi:hypothetical protein
MSAVLGAIYTMRRVPRPGDVGCPGSCPLCAPGTGRAAPCLACREELRARLAEMRLAHYVERALN